MSLRERLLPERCRRAYEALIGPLRETARGLGYALAVHGSIARDIDLVAIPWTDEAVDARALALAIQDTAQRVHGQAYMDPAETGEYFEHGCPGAKAHGRLVWSFHLGGGPYIDLSVMPRLPDA